MDKIQYGENNEPKCHACGMTLSALKEYHPYAACLMFQTCHDSHVVYENLRGIIEHTLNNKNLSALQIVNGRSSA